MFIPRHLLLYAAIAATFTATAQEMFEQRERRHIDVSDVAGSKTVTIVTSVDGNTDTQVYAGVDAEAWLAAHGGSASPEQEVYACVLPQQPGQIVGMPALCQVVVQVGGKEVAEGSSKAEVFRYRYKQKATVVQPHPDAADPMAATGKGDAAEKALVRNQARLTAEDLRVLPNPSTGLFTLAFPLPDEGGNGELYITDAAGRVVHRETVMGSGGQARTVDLRNKGKGTYIATIVLGDNTISKRLVIE